MAISTLSVTRDETDLSFPLRRKTIVTKHINNIIAEREDWRTISKILINVWPNESPYKKWKYKGVDFSIDNIRLAPNIYDTLKDLHQLDIQLIT